MKIEKTLKRENGDKVVVEMAIPDRYCREVIYRTSVSYILKGKRKPLWCSSGYSFTDTMMPWSYRSANFDERKKMVKEFIMQYVSIDELVETRNELLEKLKVDKFEFQ